MEKLLSIFIKEASGRGISFSESDLRTVTKLSNENNLAFYSEFYSLYKQFYESLVIPCGTASFQVYMLENKLIATFFNYQGEKIQELIFKNITRKELEKILFKQLVGGDYK